MTATTTPAFRNKTFGKRYEQMGDRAEGMCAQVLDSMGVKYERLGFNRPSFSIQRLPLHVRYLPDFITADAMIECQGFGRDGIAKFKQEKLAELQGWAVHMPVQVFLWWSTRKKWALLDLAEIQAAIGDESRSTLGFFDGSKPYFGIPADGLAEWRKVGEVP